jgi:hypothetical protein
VADAAFFADATRPITQMRIRWDSGFDLANPDRGEYFWARECTNPRQLVGNCRGADSTLIPGRGTTCIPRRVDYEDLSLYIEGATGSAGAFVEIPYREVAPEDPGAINTGNCCSRSGFADMNAGLKSLLLDCELIQIGFKFTTYIPIGPTGNGLGVGHVSLEPALLYTMKLTPTMYLQGESAYWIPIQGDEFYQSNIWHNHVSLNKILWRPCHDVQLIGTLEWNHWQVYQGAYTDPDSVIVATADMNGRIIPPTVLQNIGGVPVAVPNPALQGGGLKQFPIGHSGSATIMSAGPGIRGVLCDKLDLGVGTAFSFTDAHWARELIRAEFRWRF